MSNEVFRSPHTSATVIVDVLYLFSNLTLSADATASLVYVPAGLTLTVPVGVTLTASGAIVLGAIIVNGVLDLCGASDTQTVPMPTKREVFRKVTNSDIMNTTPATGRKEEAFRTPISGDKMGSYPV